MATTIPPAPIKDPWGSYTWDEWFRQVRDRGQTTGSITWSSINFTGSSLTNIVDRKHNDLSNIQGGTSAEYYHLTSAQNTFVQNYNSVLQRNVTIEYTTPSTGFNVTIANTTGKYIMVPSGTLATGTITMPATPVDGQQVTLSSTQTITALTQNPNSGQAIFGSVGTLTSNTPVSWVYRAANTTWYRI